MKFTIPGLTRNPGLLAFIGDRDDRGFFWIPAFAGMTVSDLINVAMDKKVMDFTIISLAFYIG
jgi:hypothetical protein